VSMYEQHGESANQVEVNPDSALELVLATVSEVLGVANVTAERSLFETGGDSLDAVVILDMLEEKVGRELDLDLMFSAASLREFSRVLTEADR
jgi:acyl carrier protein